MAATGLTLRRIWDAQDLVELACEVEAGVFRGGGTCYVGPDEVSTFAAGIESFIERLEGEVRFWTGLEDGTKSVCIDLVSIDMARHVVARVRLATEPQRHDGPVSRLEVELPVEPAALQVFAAELRRMRAIGDAAFLCTGPVERR